MMMKSWKKHISYFVLIAGFLVIMANLMAGCTSTEGNDSNTVPGNKGMAGQYFWEENRAQNIWFELDGRYGFSGYAGVGGVTGTYKIFGTNITMCSKFGECQECTIVEGGEAIDCGRYHYVRV
jgi:hypothetical protein